MAKAAYGAHPDGENDAAPSDSLTLFRKGAHCAPSPNAHPTFKTGLEFRSVCFAIRLSWNFPLRKCQLYQSSVKYVAMAVIQLLGILKKLDSPYYLQ